MKRVFISLLVLVMASTAGATLRIMVDGDKYPVDSQIIGGNFSLGLWTDSDIIQFVDDTLFTLVVNTLFGSIDYTSGIVVPPYDNDPGITLFHTMSAVEANFSLPPSEDGIGGSIWLMETSQIDAGSIIFDEILFHSDADFTDVMIKLYETPDGYEMPLVDSVIIHITEPTTIGLLGLGGLFLRKRKS
ncbi:MAG: PEP-CTERM sorting domain-containing protein [Planctomycetota bacterium]